MQFEGYLTYGGMNGRDMNALAIGLVKNTEFDNLEARIRQVEYLARKLDEYKSTLFNALPEAMPFCRRPKGTDACSQRRVPASDIDH